MSRAMLISRRRVHVPELDVVLSRSIHRHPSFVVRLVEYSGSIVEDRLLDAMARGTTTLPQWPVLALVLAGTAIARDGRQSWLLSPRDLLLVPSGANFRARSGDQGARAWILQWDPAVLGRAGATSSTRQRLAPRDFDRLRAEIERMAAASHVAADAAAALARVFGAASALGVLDARPEASDLLLPLPPHLVRVGAAIDRALSDLRRRPAAIDLERSLGCSPAQLRRWIHDHGSRVGPAPLTWRDLLNGWRLAVGTFLMTSPHGRTERVAEALGYRSPTAFCHAFANASLPSPGSIRRVVKELV